MCSARTLKRYGQHFLEPAWADKLVAAIDPRPGDRFLEIGPGRGALTLRLAPRAAHVTAVEIDARMVEALRPGLPANVTLVHGDILDWDFDAAATGPVRAVGNLPYNVSSPILFALVGAYRRSHGITVATVMVQREVAERIVAAPGGRDYGVLSILIQIHADVRVVLSLPPGAFRPAPKVRSSVVHLGFRPPAIPLSDDEELTRLVRSIFTRRRKTLANALQPYAASRERDPVAALSRAGIDPRRRPETLQLIELARLVESFSSS
jgi:16S rRNA (adenine1518-N6/adenine1519-N6)-dimethyltransferase